MEYYSGWRDAEHQCQACGWTGTGEQADMEFFNALVQVDCPNCFARLFLVLFPTEEEARQAAAQGNAEAMRDLKVFEARNSFLAQRESTLLTDAGSLPELDGDPLDFFITTVGESWHFLAAGQPPPGWPG